MKKQKTETKSKCIVKRISDKTNNKQDKKIELGKIEVFKIERFVKTILEIDAYLGKKNKYGNDFMFLISELSEKQSKVMNSILPTHKKY